MAVEHGDLLVELAHAADDAADDRVLVFGAAPPHGRDLDLLAREPQRSAIAARLQSSGLRNRGPKWVAFRGCAAAGVELIAAVDWQLPPAELDSLYAEARPLPGYSHLAIPAPHHVLLIAAWRAARAGRYNERLRARVAETLQAAPAAWEDAQQRAPAWRAAGLVASLRAMHDSGAQRPRMSRLRSLAARFRARPALGRRAVRALRRSTRRPLLVALSGLDGAGKSFQAAHLQRALEQLDVRAVVIWPPATNVLFQSNPAIKRRLFALLRAVGKSDGREQVAAAADDSAETSLEPLPPQRALVAHGLALIVALAQAWAFRRGAKSAGRKADVFIFDRYALDSIVYLRHRWGHGRALPLQSAIIERLSRTPARAFLLEVAPEVAYARKRDFPLENLRERAALYRQLHARLGYVSLDGERPPEDLCAEIAGSVWECLP